MIEHCTVEKLAAHTVISSLVIGEGSRQFPAGQQSRMTTPTQSGIVASPHCAVRVQKACAVVVQASMRGIGVPPLVEPLHVATTTTIISRPIGALLAQASSHEAWPESASVARRRGRTAKPGRRNRPAGRPGQAGRPA